MPNQEIHQFSLANGLSILVERLPAVQSAAVSLSFPAGIIFEQRGKNGVAALLSDLLLRGAGPYDDRQFLIALDCIGLQYSISPGWHHITFSAATVATRLKESLELIGTMVLQPHMERSHFESCVVGREQILRSIEDELRQKLAIEMRRRTYPSPYNRPIEGTLEHLDSITLEDVQEHYRRCCIPEEATLAIAGNVDPEMVLGWCEAIFGNWSGKLSPPAPELERHSYAGHIDFDSTQTQIGIAYPAVSYRDPDYYNAWATVGILSGGMSSRLFTRVREERGLCYAIGASLNTLKDRGRVFCVAGTTNERAQETLDVTLHELAAVGEDLTEEELQRCQARAKSSLIMQEESTTARAAAMVRDWFHLQKVVPLEEIRQKVDSITLDAIRGYIERHPATMVQVLTIGPEPLQVQGSVDISEM